VNSIPPEGFIYSPDLLTPDEHDTLLGKLRDLEYQHDVFRGQRLKRSYAQFGYAYVSTGRKVKTAPAFPVDGGSKRRRGGSVAAV